MSHPVSSSVDPSQGLQSLSEATHGNASISTREHFGKYQITVFVADDYQTFHAAFDHKDTVRSSQELGREITEAESIQDRRRRSMPSFGMSSAQLQKWSELVAEREGSDNTANVNDARFAANVRIMVGKPLPDDTLSEVPISYIQQEAARSREQAVKDQDYNTASFITRLFSLISSTASKKGYTVEEDGLTEAKSALEPDCTASAVRWANSDSSQTRKKGRALLSKATSNFGMLSVAAPYLEHVDHLKGAADLDPIIRHIGSLLRVSLRFKEAQIHCLTRHSSSWGRVIQFIYEWGQILTEPAGGMIPDGRWDYTYTRSRSESFAKVVKECLLGLYLQEVGDSGLVWKVLEDPPEEYSVQAGAQKVWTYAATWKMEALSKAELEWMPSRPPNAGRSYRIPVAEEDDD